MKKVILIITVALTIFTSQQAFAIDNSKSACTESYFEAELNNQLIDLKVDTVVIDYLETGQCTVSVEVSYNGVSASFSVTADTCEEAGAGAVQAASGFVKELKKIME
ncbi:hypothetical protein [Aquimarina brevivitae]|uniref:Uncharacterized protein n=1 Tax=Aquimarina brevivitae TaxID=323412 RepID=A0A4Q7P292_9FLAO|nr:hypothetical protein [Aquimarina brevivitae]RZS93875.1 hypothetical protein EV197_2456 [Aquimarina brevivitae]